MNDDPYVVSFVDTNILVYAFAGNDAARSPIAHAQAPPFRAVGIERPAVRHWGIVGLRDEFVDHDVPAGNVLGAEHRDVPAVHAEVRDVQRHMLVAACALWPVAVAHLGALHWLQVRNPNIEIRKAPGSPQCPTDQD